MVPYDNIRWHRAVQPKKVGKEGPMAKRISAREARSRFAEITDRVHYTGEPVIVEKQGQPFVAVVSLGTYA